MIFLHAAAATTFAAVSAGGAVEDVSDLGTLPAALSSTLVWPTAPTTTTESTVTNLAEFNAAAAVNGRRILVNGTISGGLAIVDADDLEIVGLPGSSIAVLNIIRNRHRIKFENCTIEQVNFNLPAYFDDELGQQVFDVNEFVTDVTFDNCTVNSPTESAFNVYGRRVAILNSDITANWYSVWAGQTSDFFQQDIIIANCAMSSAGTEATIRMLQTERSVVVGCTLTNGNKHNWRQHLGSTLAYCGRNTFVNAGFMLTDPAEPSDTLGTFWFEDNDVTYTLSNGVIITLDPYTRIDAGTIKNNTFVMTGATVFSDIWSYGAVPGDWDLTGNVIQAP